MAGEMNKKEIEEGGDWYDSRLELEEVAREMGCKKFEVNTFDQYQGPYCFCGELQGSIWLTDKEGIYYFKASDRSGLMEFNTEFDLLEASDLAKRIRECIKLAA